ncbi:mechanosensitive ion channel family protein [Rhodobacteraceae bacterium CCMM004]|nr:mechanosensitive ion channel family protein [Rhodobacteraceae bacterium CCMM004]
MAAALARNGTVGLLWAVALWLVLSVAGLAQSAGPEDADEWERLATRAEAALESGRASDLALGQLRTELAAFRDRFVAAQDENAARIATLETQIAALGPEPGEGDPPEPQEISDRRSELSRQLAILAAPRTTAELNYNRADGLIREIDNLLRARQADALLSRGPSPLNPAHWPGALSDLAESFAELRREAEAAVSSDAEIQQIQDRLPRIVLFLVIAVVLVLRGRLWMERLALALYSGGVLQGSGVLGFLASLGQVIVPVLGLIALREALFASGILGLRGQVMAETLPTIGVIVFSALWLGARLFPRRGGIATPLDLPDHRWRSGRRVVGGLGVVLGAQALLYRLAEFDNYPEASEAVILFPLMVVLGFGLYRLGLLLRQSGRTAAEDGGGGAVSGSSRLLGRAAIVFGIAAPVFAAIGYGSLAAAVMGPALMSLALLALIGLLHILARDLWALVRGRSQEEAREALAPTLFTLVLSAASLPLFALLWGARWTDLLELWRRIGEGFSIGETRLSPSNLLTFVLVFAIGFAVTRLLQGTLRSTVLPKTRIDPGARTALVSGIGYVGILLAALFAVTAAGINLTSLAFVAGALSVGIGFGLQNIVQNFVAGIILLIERPISEGDWISVGGDMGHVRDISVRSTRIETFDKTDVIVPNADFVSGKVINYTRGNLTGRAIVSVGVAYGTDTRHVERVLREIAEAHPLVVLNPPPFIYFAGFGSSSLDFEIRAILRDVNFLLSVKTDMNHEIARRFAEEGIEIPFPQQDLWLRNPEAVASAVAPEAAPARRAVRDDFDPGDVEGGTEGDST